MNREKDIIKALQSKIVSVVNNVLPVKYLNINFQIPDDGKWWEVVYIPNNVENEFWGKEKTYQGILRLVLHWPQNNEGIYKALEEMTRVAEGFDKGEILNFNDISLKIYETPSTTGILEEAPNLIIPLTIKYTCFTI